MNQTSAPSLQNNLLSVIKRTSDTFTKQLFMILYRFSPRYKRVYDRKLVN